ncbi:hypothetical protein CPter91_3626 [Collimonas pratensis]|uniref:Uncharacterized protein n=1 Tax=Collimonas pratensis TaxID=279113 RepID=A0A127Q7D5_9BURK|nr:hypothetical protein CPter91_3626 [Collimonas pratensis]
MSPGERLTSDHSHSIINYQLIENTQFLIDSTCYTTIKYHIENIGSECGKHNRSIAVIAGAGFVR